MIDTDLLPVTVVHDYIAAQSAVAKPLGFLQRSLRAADRVPAPERPGREAVLFDRIVCWTCLQVEVADRRGHAGPQAESLFEDREEVR